MTDANSRASRSERATNQHKDRPTYGYARRASMAHLPVAGGPPEIDEALREWRKAGGYDRAFSVGHDGRVKLIDFSKPLASRERKFNSMEEALTWAQKGKASQ